MKKVIALLLVVICMASCKKEYAECADPNKAVFVRIEGVSNDGTKTYSIVKAVWME